MGFKPKTVGLIKLPKKVVLLQQTYDKEAGISGVVVLKNNIFPDDLGGWFKENVRLNEDGEIISLKDLGISLKVRQSNISFIAAGGKRFWHIHPNQTELWSTSGTLLVGLIDFRKDSPSYGKRQRVVLSSIVSVYIPAGVAHGFLNPNNFSVTLTYFADKQFSADQDTQECRISPDEVPFDFVQPDLM